jgi:hypothetical protein
MHTTFCSAKTITLVVSVISIQLRQKVFAQYPFINRGSRQRLLDRADLLPKVPKFEGRNKLPDEPRAVIGLVR